MASAPRWRFTRKRVPALEKGIGLFIVLVLAGLAALFWWDVRRPAESPFALDPQLLSQAARPVDAVAAGYLLPAGSNPQIERVSAPLLLETDGVAFAAATDTTLAETYRVRRGATAPYRVNGQNLKATVVETEGPEWAFGLCGAARPEGAEPLTIGGGTNGWQTADAGAFWAGRYYVEVTGEASASGQSPTGEGQASAKDALLAELAGVHVFHGRPFAAEAVLPQAGLKTDSLRFAPGGAFGIAAIKPAFVADYDGGMQVAVVALGSPALAQAAMATAGQEAAQKATQPSDAEDEPSDTEYEEVYDEGDGEAAAAAASDAAAPGIPDADGRLRIALPEGNTIILHVAGRYLLAAKAAGDTAPAIALLDEAARLAQPAVVTAGAAPGARQADGPLPALDEPDLTGPMGVRRFDAQTLYEKINGNAPLYHSFGFEQLLFATYAAGEQSLDAYVYDMGQADNAFGIYKAEQPGEAEAASIGREGYFSGSSVFFWKGRYYVYILATTGGDGHDTVAGEAARPAALKLAGAIAAGIQAGDQSLWAERVLPAGQQVAGSFEYIKSDAFGLDFLKDVFSARYERDGRELTLFVMRTESPEQARETLAKYETFAGKYGKVTGKEESDGALVLTTETLGAHDVVFTSGRYFGGVTAAEDGGQARAVVTEWVKQLSGN